MVPLWAALISSIGLVATAFLVEEPINAVAIIFGTFFSMLLCSGLIQKLTMKLPVHPIFATVLIPPLYALSLSPMYLMADLLDWDVSTEQIHALLLFGTIVGVITFAAQFSQLQRKTTTEKLTGVNQQLEILNASLRQELWLNRSRTASVLHGPVQAALFASAMKLSQAPEPTPQLVAEVDKDIQDALEKLNNPSNLAGEEISAVLEQIVEIWSDAAEITILLPEQLEREISHQPLTSEALIEISREFINNAIKHGKAENISLRVFRVDPYLLAVEVTDDGQGLPPGAKPGFGSKLLTELSLVWRQSRVEDKTVSYAEIVLGQEPN